MWFPLPAGAPRRAVCRAESTNFFFFAGILIRRWLRPLFGSFLPRGLNVVVARSSRKCFVYLGLCFQRNVTSPGRGPGVAVIDVMRLGMRTFVRALRTFDQRPLAPFGATARTRTRYVVAFFRPGTVSSTRPPAGRERGLLRVTRMFVFFLNFFFGEACTT